MDFVQLKTVQKSTKKVATDVLITIKLIKMAHVHHMIQTVSPETFMKIVLVVNKVFMLIKHQNVKLVRWVVIMSMVYVQAARLLLFIIKTLLPATLMDANNTSLVVAKFVKMDINLDTTHVNYLIVWSLIMENVYNVTQIIS